MHIFFLTPVHAAQRGAEITERLLNKALAGTPDVTVAGTATMDAAHGAASASLFANVNDIDVVIAYGKTSQSFGDEMKPMSVRRVVLPAHGKASKLICLPAAASSWWDSPDNVNSAVAYVQSAVDAVGEGEAQFVCWPEASWN
jgi:hypothetical protein